jgi:hypothetical protein
MTRFAGTLLALMGLAWPAVALADDYKTLWDDYQDELAFGDPPAWSTLTSNYSMDIGMVETVSVVMAWRQGSEVGAYLRYVYAEPASPAELPGPGPMKTEEVEATLNCAAQTVRIHTMYLYRPDGTFIGKWYDPSAAQNPTGYGASSIMGLAAARLC